jgi:aminoglycoside phosphotransferase family enzyme/predicted kinase
MELSRLIDALSSPAAYPYAVDEVKVCQTHISVVFLAGSFAYKLKKPVDLGFLNFNTLEKRRHFCEEEVRLNRRLAADVYLGVVPITAAGRQLTFEGTGKVIEWAVKMRRLPEEATLEKLLQRGELTRDLIETLARELAFFHTRAEGGESMARFGSFAVVARNARENFEQALPLVGITLSRAVYDRLRELSEDVLRRLQPLIDQRSARGVPRDTHGDLHLDHVYRLREGPGPDKLVIVDCIEFNERFRFADPVADMAFLYMDLLFHGRKDLAHAFAEAYFRAAGDDEGRALLPFYTAYRAAVRGKVEGFELAEQEVPQTERAAALKRAHAHWLLALGELEEPGRKPCLVLVVGLPGSGKSTLAQLLAARAGFAVIRSDVVRKELAGISRREAVPVSLPEDLYTTEWNDRTYQECWRRAEQLWFEGRRVLVDASFREDKRRQYFLESAIHWGVPPLVLGCGAEPEMVRERLAARRNDVSDADWVVYLESARQWQEPGPFSRQYFHELSTAGDPEHVLSTALAILRQAGL